jgi:hypothetical protein
MTQNQGKPKAVRPRVNPDLDEKLPYPVNNQLFKMGKHEDLGKNNQPIHAFPSRNINMKNQA